jgi:hypothetical protein
VYALLRCCVLIAICTWHCLCFDCISLLPTTNNRVRHCILKGNFGETRPPVLRLLKDSDVQMKQGQPDKVIKVYIYISIVHTATYYTAHTHCVDNILCATVCRFYLSFCALCIVCNTTMHSPHCAPTRSMLHTQCHAAANSKLCMMQC